MSQQKRKKRHKLHGWLILDKPLGLSSNQALGKVKKSLHSEKAGHAGTLDPLATGVLPIALGEATKTVSFGMDGTKTYEFTIGWGIETSTLDVEGEPIATSDVRPSKQDVLQCLGDFVGEIEQVPPIYSALKIDGKRAYDLARQGKDIEMKARKIMIKALSLIAWVDDDHATFSVTCGKGTYVRSLARDIALKLGTKGHVTYLRRTRVGAFTLEDTILLDKLEELGHSASASENIASLLLPIETVLDDILALAIDENEAQRIRHGQKLSVKGRAVPEECDDVYVTSNGLLVALVSITKDAIIPRRIFNLP